MVSKKNTCERINHSAGTYDACTGFCDGLKSEYFLVLNSAKQKNK